MLEIRNITKTFGRFSIRDVNLSVGDDDYFILLGASGAGKSVLLEIIAGLVIPDSGEIMLNGRDITRLGVDKRKTGMIFQTPAIFPHLTIRQNIGYPMKHQKTSRPAEKVELLARQMNISHLLGQKPANLSGGELQRVALARTLASEPVMLLLDEPLSAVDAHIKSGLRTLLRDLNRQGLPVLHVTHDYEEALALATHMAVIENGSIIQSGTPGEILSSPRSGFTAGFSGEHNFFKAFVSSNTATISSGGDNPPSAVIKLNDHYDSGPANVLIRSKYVIISVDEPHLSTVNNFSGIITSINPSREGYEVCLRSSIDICARITDESLKAMKLTTGMKAWACFKASSVDVIR